MAGWEKERKRANDTSVIGYSNKLQIVQNAY